MNFQSAPSPDRFQSQSLQIVPTCWNLGLSLAHQRQHSGRSPTKAMRRRSPGAGFGPRGKQRARSDVSGGSQRLRRRAGGAQESARGAGQGLCKAGAAHMAVTLVASICACACLAVHSFATFVQDVAGQLLQVADSSISWNNFEVWQSFR